jgi:hypothetical protein
LLARAAPDARFLHHAILLQLRNFLRTRWTQ